MRRPHYCKVAPAAGEVPTPFTSVTVTEVTACGLLVLNGCVYVKLLPYCPAAALPYHDANIVFTGTLSEVVPRLVPLNWKLAVVSASVLEYPTMVTVNPVLLRTAVMLAIAGAVAGTVIVLLGAGVGVMSSVPACRRAVIVMVPATVPVCTPTVVNPVVWPAGTVMVAVVPPVENCTAGSAPVKVSVKVTVTDTG